MTNQIGTNVSPGLPVHQPPHFGRRFRFVSAIFVAVLFAALVPGVAFAWNNVPIGVTPLCAPDQSHYEYTVNLPDSGINENSQWAYGSAGLSSLNDFNALTWTSLANPAIGNNDLVTPVGTGVLYVRWTDDPTDLLNYGSSAPNSNLCNTPTPTPSNTPTASPSATPTATMSATPTASPSATPSATPSNTPTASPSATPTATMSATPTSTPSATPTAIPSNTPMITPTGHGPSPSAMPDTAAGQNDPGNNAPPLILFGLILLLGGAGYFAVRNLGSNAQDRA